MAISSVSLTNTFDEWRIRTNQVINSLNTINEANGTYTGTIIITNPLGYQGNVSLNVSSGMIRGDGGLIGNVQSSVVANAAFLVANAAFNAANAAPQTSRVNTIFTVSNAAYNHANAAFDAANTGSRSRVIVSNTAPPSPNVGSLWWNDVYGRLLLYYDDGNSQQWVDTSTTSSIGAILDQSNATLSQANAVFDAANLAFNVFTTNANASFNAFTTGANTKYDTFAVSVNNSVNVIQSHVNTAFDVSNASFNLANSAYAQTSLIIDTNDNMTVYPAFVTVTTGRVSSLNVSSSKLTFNPSSGTLSATVFNSLSDATLKEDVTPITNALDIISKLSGVGFSWKDSGEHSYGVLAQNMEKVVPDLVGNLNSMKTVNYDGIIAFLIEAIKELNNKLENKE